MLFRSVGSALTGHAARADLAGKTTDAAVIAIAEDVDALISADDPRRITTDPAGATLPLRTDDAAGAAVVRIGTEVRASPRAGRFTGEASIGSATIARRTEASVGRPTVVQSCVEARLAGIALCSGRHEGRRRRRAEPVESGRISPIRRVTGGDAHRPTHAACAFGTNEAISAVGRPVGVDVIIAREQQPTDEEREQPASMHPAGWSTARARLHAR